MGLHNFLCVLINTKKLFGTDERQFLQPLASTTDEMWTQHAKGRSWSASSLKLNIWFVSGPTVLHWEGYDSFIWSAIKVNEHMMESLFDRISNGSDVTSYHIGKVSKSSRYVATTTTTSSTTNQVLEYHRVLVFHLWHHSPW